MFIGGFATSGRSLIAWVLMTEFMYPESLVIASTSICVLDATNYFLVTAYFDWISPHYRYICGVGLIQTVAVMLVVALLVPESPLFQLKNG